MGIFDRLRGSSVPARTHVAEPARLTVAPELSKPRGLRKGMWVAANRQVGILIGLDYEESVGAVMARVQLVEPDGTNRMIDFEMPNGSKVPTPHAISVEVSLVRQADYQEIPLKRRPPRDLGVSFGYPGA